MWIPAVTNNMGGMFNGCTAFNGDLSSWDVSNVTCLGIIAFIFITKKIHIRVKEYIFLYGISDLALGQLFVS